jgi:glyoxylase I family protein
MKTTGIHHIAIICSDYESSKRFYVEVLGFSKLDLQVGKNQQIELFSFPNPPKRINNPEACGLRHLAFEVEDIEQTVLELKSKGVELENIRIDEITGKRFTFFKDPDNLPLEIYER